MKPNLIPFPSSAKTQQRILIREIQAQLNDLSANEFVR